ncbi:MAG: FHA domain-containing protein [Christensenellaceae bacterium]|nr:FHA domain-containing protein [Christensenellaceae bacterium]
MSPSVYEAIAFAMRYWFILVIAIILIAVIVISVREYKARKSVMSRMAEFAGFLEIVGGADDLIGEKFGICDENLIGSAYSCDICIPDKGVKKKHAVIYIRDDVIMVRPVGRSVILVNEDLVKGPHALRTGDVISLGNASLRVFIKRKRVGNDY